MYRNLPVVSWLLQRGRAACCGAPIPRWYLGVEAGTIAIAAAGGAWLGWAAGMLAAVVAGVLTVAVHHDRWNGPKHHPS